MHVYGWPINAKLASSDWDQRRKDSSSSHGRQYEGGEQVRRTRDSSSSRGAKGSDFLTFVPNSDRSYVEVVYGQSYDPSKYENIVTMSWTKKKDEREWLTNCAVGTLKTFKNFGSVRDRLKSRGFSFSASYLGDNHILWCFETQIDRDGFLANRFFWEDCFRSMKRWNVSHIPKSKLVWIECNEVPLFCWNSNFFLKLGGMIGEPLLVEEDTVMKRKLDKGRVMVSEDQDPVEASWVKHQLGLQKDDLNSNPSSRRERANSLEGEGAASIHSLPVKDMGNRGVGRKIRKEVRDKSPSLDLQLNQRAWKGGKDRDLETQHLEVGNANGLTFNMVGLPDNNPKMGQVVVFSQNQLSQASLSKEKEVADSQLRDPTSSADRNLWLNNLGEQRGDRLDAIIKKRGSNMIKSHIMQPRILKKGQ
ncbi:hypothetical protein LWI29_008247 [Acer saccharum]|uniref:DUF4283 domain-containing protein n=1 Tax=Acer saccharum TaxID=4024 RepID=A0AA39RWQ1_ACESA|nr:hypothetical protein LWI29_008247 [Acer saccharum]